MFLAGDLLFGRAAIHAHRPTFRFRNLPPGWTAYAASALAIAYAIGVRG